MLATRGYDVHAVDRDGEALAALRTAAADQGVTVRTTQLDLEQDVPDLGLEHYGTVIVFNYLHRPLFPALVRALAPDGVLLYETFTIGQAQRACPERAIASRRSHPRNPLFLLQPGELAALVAPLAVLAAREGEFGGNVIASIAARKVWVVASRTCD